MRALARGLVSIGVTVAIRWRERTTPPPASQKELHEQRVAEQVAARTAWLEQHRRQP